MRIESLTVKCLRSGRQYSNDTTEIRVVLEGGDDWTEIEPRLRDQAVGLIDEHWRRVEDKEREKRAQEQLRRNEWVKQFMAEHPGDSPCPACDWEECAGCPRNDGIPF